MCAGGHELLLPDTELHQSNRNTFFNLIYFVLLCLQAMDAGHTFRSVIAHSICASIEGNHHSQSLCHIHALPILSFFFLAFRTIRLCCTPSSLWGRWRSKTDQCRPSEPFAPAFELDNGSMRPSHSPYTFSTRLRLRLNRAVSS